ncbi:4Fe-4S cluster-binding domain-containing protein [uncultured Methanobacterium sp.]|uniref:radical SAM protein n=1 Tax=uncultured Methanobacterium sp. TaxID=176306 RepID=UPI002AA610F4|nr:4Fe-4S cluster-binding domain-containing protein [uncultured Methanobacterium sp.]
MNKRILQYENDARRILKALSSKQAKNDMPYPKMAYIYPTYQCSLHCKNCMYKDHIKECKKNKSLDMDLQLFRTILTDLSSLGVMNVELCGGGEPLEHGNINEIIEVVSEFRRNNRMDFGILTNGQSISRLNENTLKIILECFAYIRLSFSEQSSENIRLREEYFNNLSQLLEYKEKNKKLKAIIGSKLLLTSKNKDKLLETVSELLDLGVEHLKIKSIRSPDDEPSFEDLIEVEEELRSLKSEKSANDILQVDLGKTVYPAGFKCWINPLSVTIDPYGGIYICYNFHNDPENMMIGKYNKNNSLSDFWGKLEHVEKIRNINTELVCESDTSCNCRFVEYQNILEKISIEKNNLKHMGNDDCDIRNSLKLKRIDRFL